MGAIPTRKELSTPWYKIIQSSNIKFALFAPRSGQILVGDLETGLKLQLKYLFVFFIHKEGM